MGKCSAYLCKSTTYGNIPGLTFHRHRNTSRDALTSYVLGIVIGAEFSQRLGMIQPKRYFVGVVLLFFANVAFTEETDAANDVKVEFVEDVTLNNASRIVSGWDALPGQHPHQVSLRHISRLGSVSGCGGVLIHHRWVLTAAHCIARASVTTVVRVGVTRLSTPEHISETTVSYVYPMYDWSRPNDAQPDDIALVRLVKPVPYTKYTKPIRIQLKADAFRDYSGQVAYTSGFGRTWTEGPSPAVLQWVFLNLISNDECRKIYGKLITPNSICAGPFNVTSQSICQGDSGGPLVYIAEDGVPTLIGITSFIMGGEYGCHSGYPGAFVRPGPFHGWLRDVTGLDFENLEEEEEDEEVMTTTIETPTTTPQPKPEESSEGTKESSEETEESSEETEESSEETEESSKEDSSSEEDPELKDLKKRLEIQVNVKVKMNKFRKKHEVHVKHNQRRKKKNKY